MSATATTPVVPPITASEACGNSRPVPASEFQRIALEGRDRLRAIQSENWSAKGLNANWETIKRTVYAKVRKPWGGATIDPRTGREIPQGVDLYALSTKSSAVDTTSVSEHVTREEFNEAMDIARAKYARELARGGTYLGIFHDDDNARIDIDPVTVVATLADVESIGAYTHAIRGAYYFATGEGYFPPHVMDTEWPSGHEEAQAQARLDERMPGISPVDRIRITLQLPADV